MLIGLLSDTHIPDHAKKLPDQLEEVFRGVDLILHGGDIFSISVLNELERIAPVLAAEGDDDFTTTANDSRVKRKHTISIDGVTIWLMHQRPQSLSVVSEKAPWIDEPPDAIVFGHTHEATLENHQGILQINPGSPTFPRYRLQLGTVGLLSVNSGKAEARIIQLK